VHIIKNNAENILNRTVSTTLVNTSDILIANKYDTLHEDDCTVAEEFNENEEHISSDLEKRNTDKSSKLPRLLIAPRTKLLSERLYYYDRKRSITYGCGIFSRKKRYIRTTLIRGPSLKAIKEEQKVTEGSPNVRLTNCSIDSKLGASDKKCKQKENFDVSYNTSGNSRDEDIKRKNAFHLDGKLGRELKDKLSSLMSKGPNKFSNTTQARPKIITRKEDINDLNDLLNDDLNTIRTNKIAKCSVHIIKHKQ